MEQITSRSNALVAHMRKLGSSRSYRRAHGEFLCDGEKLLSEALSFGGRIRAMLIEKGETPPELPSGVRVAQVPGDLLRWVSPLDQPQKLLFSCSAFPADLPERLFGTSYAVLDGVQDPGNVGTILRTASAFAISGVFLTGNCADPFHPKTIRATMGAVFRMPVWETDYEALRRLLTRAGLPLYGAALQTGAKSPQTLSGGFPAAVAIGSEGKGLSPALLSLCDQTVRIPMEPGCESLNAASAAAVLFWERYKGGEGGK